MEKVETRSLRVPWGLICLAVGAGIWALPAPQGITDQGWHLFAVFVSVILGIIFKPLPMGAVAFLGLTVLCIGRVLTFEQAISAVSGSVVWLVICAFFIARGFLSSGLAIRIAYKLAALFGKSSLGLGYGMLLCDLILAPTIPSDTARAGGVIYPILKGLSQNFGSRSNDGTARKLGAYLTMTAYHGAAISSCMFLTAMATNPLLAQLNGSLGYPISWGLWFVAASVPGLVSFCVIPLLLYLVYPPGVRKTPDSVKIAREKIKEMGPMSQKEWITAGVFVLLLLLWIFGSLIGISSTVAAMTGVCILLLTRVLNWKDFVQNHDAWEIFIWFSTLIMMATYLSEFGVSTWFGTKVLTWTGGLDWHIAFPIIACVYFGVHYLFAGNTAQVSALYIPFATIALQIGTPPMLALLTLTYFSCLFASLTHYGSACGPVLYGAGYVDVKTWWKLGLLVSLTNILIWLTIGAMWWKFLGLF